MKNFYKKEYLPGYTGHVPHKVDMFGMTAGDVNQMLISKNGAERFYQGDTLHVTAKTKDGITKNLKAIQYKYKSGKEPAKNPNKPSNGMQRSSSTTVLPNSVGNPGRKSFSGSFSSSQAFGKHEKLQQRLKFGNTSRKAYNWIGGPNHELQPQHIPGYTGHVSGIKSENMFSKSFARSTAMATTK